MNFKLLLFESIFLDLVKLGGNAVTGVLRIQKDNINGTVDQLLKTIILPTFPNLVWNLDMFLLGSTGKKSSSGDIDIGIDFTKLNVKTIMLGLLKLFTTAYKSNLCPEIKVNNITNDMLHISFPQFNPNGLKIGKTVQIDILLTPFKLFCKFYMYSPSEILSKYKGAHRNELLRGIIKTLTYKPLAKKNTLVVRWKQYDLNSMGLYDEEKTLVDDNGNKLKYKDTNLDLIPAYAKVLYSKPISHKPLDVIHLLVGLDFSLLAIDTFEKLFRIILSDPKFRYDKSRYLILHNTAISLKENNKLVFPELLLPYS